MFEAIGKAILEGTSDTKKDEEKIQRRKSRRLSNSKNQQAADEEMSVGLGSEGADDDNNEPKQDRDGKRSSEVKSVTSDIDEDDEDLIEDRDKWSNDYIVLVHLLSFAVGGSNVWRFAYLCYEYGGILHLIPYLFFTITCALPCLYLELLVGQYTQVGAISAWKLAPMFKGVGMSMTFIAFMSLVNIQSIVAWCLFYMVQSAVYNPLPWVSCDNGFGKMRNGQEDETVVRWLNDDETEEDNNWHTENCTEFYADSGTDAVLGVHERLPGTEYFWGRVQRMWKSGYADKHLDKTFSLDNGQVAFGLDSREQGILEYNSDTFISLIFVFIFVEICVARGIRVSAKIMLFLVISPLIILMLLFYRATGLNGAWEGLTELFKPNASKLALPETWWKSAEQVFYSTGAGYGVHLTCASHSPVSRRIVYDATITVLVDTCTSILAACTIFMFLGHVKVAVNREIQIFVRSGPELIFEVMSDVLGVLAKSNYYAFIFYLFMFLLTFNTVVTALICTKTAYLEVLPTSLKEKTAPRVMLMSLIYVISFICTSLNLTRGGLHTYSFIGTFVGQYSAVFCAFLFFGGIAWFVGLKEIILATGEMGIRSPGLYFQICWKFISPFVLAMVFLGLVFDPSTHEVMFQGRKIPLGTGLYIVGYVVALGPCSLVIGGAIHELYKQPGKNLKQKLLLGISPTYEHRSILATGTGKRAKFSHYFYLYAPTPGVKLNICCSFQHDSNKVAPEIQVIKASIDNLNIPNDDQDKKKSLEDDRSIENTPKQDGNADAVYSENAKNEENYPEEEKLTAENISDKILNESGTRKNPVRRSKGSADERKPDKKCIIQ